ncbi:Activator of stress protein 1 [Colletotrichum gloeosporioides]|uniref:Activator of stress protein 1 n=1 Tax=Colletotrichum gloeosporioides TaxID=474922 RepID=A0A8H4CAQ5_COLGL|nr:Activator of stress protein 1 [Colletotrichum gloeosporioides]KAF3800288.1 Activator of stress protein 1 [Colletotrichum gloeosporioides]
MSPPPRPVKTDNNSPPDSQASGVSPNMSDNESAAPSAGWPVKEPPSPSGSHSGSDMDEKAGGPDAPNAPVQKRRRVTRACDECRRKKIKCDGKQPCTHCSVYSYECTYDKPSNRRRNPAPQYIEALESRLQRAEALLRKFMPDVDLADPTLDPAVQQEFRNREHARAAVSKLRQDPFAIPEEKDAQLLSMIESIGQLDLDEKGGWDFHGVSSGAVFLRRMKENFRGMMGPVTKVPFLPRPERPAGLINLDSPASAASSPFDASLATAPELPPKEVARKLCYYSLNCATCLIRVVHVPTFYELFDRVYEKSHEDYTKEEHRFVGLLFAVMALGCMYANLDETAPPVAYKESAEEGMKYYDTARRILQDITECRDLTSLQALLFMILFLQATSNLSGCYAFVGIALRSALRMGLHRFLKHEQISIIEQEVRKRVFWVIRQMDIYVSAMLGFPLLLNADDIDQPYPTEIDDEYITNEGILTPPPGVFSFFEAFNAHTRLMEILAKILKFVYPLKGLGQSVMKGDKPGATYLISYANIKRIETELQEWYEVLPAQWRPSPDGPVEVIRVRHLLRFAYAHVQLVLYRPFLHYVSPRISMDKNIDELSYACAAACISVSRNIVHIGIEIRKQNVLAGPYWFMLFTEFFAILSLVFYAIENPEKPGSAEVLEDAIAGRDIVAKLKNKSQAADRVTDALNVLFEQLPERLRQAKAQPIPTKKRSAPGPKTSSIPIHGHPGMHGGMNQRRSEDMSRSPSVSIASGRLSHVRGSFDGVPISEAAYQDPNLAMQDLLSMDMASRATPDSVSTSASSTRPQGFPPPHAHSNNMNHISKLDSLMFPSEDPFAYPNQPMMELGYQKGPGPNNVSGPQDASSFMMPGAFDDIDTQLLGQSPAYFLHQGQGQQQPPQQHHHQHHQSGFDMSNMYQHSGYPGMSDAARIEQARRAHMQQQRPGDIDRMLAESAGYQSNWAAGLLARNGYQGL